MLHIEAGLALVRMTFDDLQDAAGYVCTKRDFESANGDDEDEEEDEEEEEEEEKKKEKDEEDEDDDDDEEGAVQRLSRHAGKIEQDIAGLKRSTQLAKLSRRVRESSTPEAWSASARRLKRAGYDFAPRTLSWINPAIRARVSIAIDENSAGVFRTIGLASVNRVRA